MLVRRARWPVRWGRKDTPRARRPARGAGGPASPPRRSTTDMATATEPRRATRRTFQTKMLIDGQWRDSASGKTFETVNPATEEVIARVAEGDAADIEL